MHVFKNYMDGGGIGIVHHPVLFNSVMDNYDGESDFS